MSIKIKGLDQLQRKLKDLQTRAKKLDGKKITITGNSEAEIKKKAQEIVKKELGL